MRLSDEMIFPHPVLADWRTDHDAGTFNADIAYQQDEKKDQVKIRCDLRIENTELDQLLDAGDAEIGVFALCATTGLRRLVTMKRGVTTYVFGPGELLGSVILRPLVWITKEFSAWTPAGINSEFPDTFALRDGEIVAIGEELSIVIGKLPLPNLETIFSIAVQDGLADGEFQLNMDNDKITILACRETYDLVESVRKDSKLKSIAMNAVYVPVVMQVLAVLRDEGGEAYSGRRWFEPFRERCERLKVEIDEGTMLFADAAKVLDLPFGAIAEIQPERS